jgi:uncharacterized membrane protein YjjB (DUF3815 family)
VDLKRIKKALAAGAGAGVGAGVAALLNAIPDVTRDEVSVIIGATIVAAFGTGWATWKVRNVGAGMVAGSDIPPREPTRRYRYETPQ